MRIRPKVIRSWSVISYSLIAFPHSSTKTTFSSPTPHTAYPTQSSSHHLLHASSTPTLYPSPTLHAVNFPQKSHQKPFILKCSERVNKLHQIKKISSSKCICSQGFIIFLNTHQYWLHVKILATSMWLCLCQRGFKLYIKEWGISVGRIQKKHSRTKRWKLPVKRVTLASWLSMHHYPMVAKCNSFMTLLTFNKSSGWPNH